MNAPPPGPSDAPERGRPSPSGSPYSNARSPSGHLKPPSPTRRYSRHYATSPSFTGQALLHEEPGEIQDSHATAGSIPPPSPSLTLYSHSSTLNSPGHAQNSDAPARSSHPASLSHQIDEQTTRPGTSDVKLSPRAAFQLLGPEHQQSKTTLSTKSSRTFSSQHTRSSASSTGRASYRRYRGPPYRPGTPATPQRAAVGLSPLRAEPCVATAPPNAGNLNQPEGPGSRFRPMSVNDSLRYEKFTTRDASKLEFNIEAMKYQYPEEPEDVPEGWTACRHPEGALYFVDYNSRTLTDVNICEEEARQDIEYMKSYLFSELKAEIQRRGLFELKVDQVLLVLEPKVDDEGVLCCYYFVNPCTKTLFWLDGWDHSDIFDICGGTLSDAHKGLAIRAQYWYVAFVYEVAMIKIFPRKHCVFFPNFCQVTPELKNWVLGTILYAESDHLMSDTSSCPLSLELLRSYRSLVQQINTEDMGTHDHSVIIIGRIISKFYDASFDNYHWEGCARLNDNESVHGWRYHPSALISILAPLLFMAPVDNVRLLHNIYVDCVVNRFKWKEFVTKLNSHLKETSVLATVLLNANVGFLPKEPAIGTAAQQFITYMSLAASMTSMILGLVFMGQVSIESRKDPRKAAAFLHSLWDERHGLERLGIIYSLPHAFLMWGMGLFFAAIVVQWFNGGYPGGWQLRAGGAALVLPVIILAAWSIWTIRDQSDNWWFKPDSYQAMPEGEAGQVLSRRESAIRSSIGSESRSVQESCHMHPDVQVRNQPRTLLPALLLPRSSSSESIHMRDLA